MIVDVGKHARKVFGLATVICIGVGGGAVYSGAIGQVEGGQSSVIGAYIVGGGIALVGLIFLLLFPLMGRARGYVLDAEGIGFRDSNTKFLSWTVPWKDLRAIAVSTTEPRQRTPAKGKPGSFNYRSGSVLASAGMVVVRAMPCDERYSQWHRELNSLWRRGELWVELGPKGKYLASTEDALRRFVPDKYCGVVAADQEPAK